MRLRPSRRIMDFGKFKYQQSKRQHKSPVRQAKLKEIRVRPQDGRTRLKSRSSTPDSFSSNATRC